MPAKAGIQNKYAFPCSYASWIPACAGMTSLLSIPQIHIDRLLEKEGAIQRFEVAFELAWKTLKDYLEESGVVVNPVTPRSVIKEAFAAKLLDDGQVWIDMMLHRNLLSHTYDIAVFEAVLRIVAERYFPAFDRLHEFFLLRRVEP